MGVTGSLEGGVEGRRGGRWRVWTIKEKEKWKKSWPTATGPYGGSKVAGGKMGAGGMATGATTLCGGADGAG